MGLILPGSGAPPVTAQSVSGNGGRLARLRNQRVALNVAGNCAHITQEDRGICFFTDFRTKSKPNPQSEEPNQATPPLRCSRCAHSAGPTRSARGGGEAESGVGMGSGAAAGEETEARLPA